MVQQLTYLQYFIGIPRLHDFIYLNIKVTLIPSLFTSVNILYERINKEIKSPTYPFYVMALKPYFMFNHYIKNTYLVLYIDKAER